MDEIKADDGSPLLENQKPLQSINQEKLIAIQTVGTAKSNSQMDNPYQNQHSIQPENESLVNHKLPENPLSTPFLKPTINQKFGLQKNETTTDRRGSVSKSSENFSVSSSNRGDDENIDVTDQVGHDQSIITSNENQTGVNNEGKDQKLNEQGVDDKNQLVDQQHAIGDGPGLIPEAMPLYQRKISLLNSKEPDIYARMKRGIMNQYMNQKEPCSHDEGIQFWKCLKCKGNISRFGFAFDDNEGKVSHFTKIVYENSFLQDFKEDFRNQAIMSGKQNSNGGTVLYTAYQPNNLVELKEYMFMILSKKIKKVNKAANGNLLKQSPFGTGAYQSLSGRLLKYLTHHNTRRDQLKQQYGDSCLMFDSIFESGNLLQAEKSPNLENTYNLYMQVDTNTRGHQQWFYFKAKGGKKGVTYTFNIMNFTKPGVTGGRGYKNGEVNLRIKVRSKKQQIINNNFEKWEDLTNDETKGKCEYVKTNVARRKKDVIAAGADSDQEDWVEEAFNKPPAIGSQLNKDQMPQINVNGPQTGITNIDPVQIKEKPKKRRTFYYYALRFNYQFKHDEDSVYFAFSQPVTYTDILTDIHNKEKILMPKVDLKKPAPLLKNGSSRMKVLENKVQEEQVDPMAVKYSTQKMLKENQFQKTLLIENPSKLIYYNRTELCRTLAGNPLYKIVISRDQRCARKNQIVLITSRVHSGESPGSQVFQGIYDFITSDCREAKYLRRFYTFILIPCMNPDGVIVGNYRNSLAGVDLNRQWINPDLDFHPEVCAVKNLMQQIKEEDKRQIWIFCDLHGHSKKKNSFFYGCNTAANGGFLSWTIVRLLPRIFAQKTHMFNYKDCRFRVEPYKIGTARIVAWKQFQITHSFTLENSFYGFDVGEDEDRIFTQEDYKNVGLKFTMSIYEMHFLWKQIKRELQVTHGWLKPRTLNEMTGVPAAQIMHEETALLKEEERKKKAIEQYEQFLKTFYKSSKPIFSKKKNDDKDGKLDKNRAQAILEKSKLRDRDKQVLDGNEKGVKSRNGLNGSKMLTDEKGEKRDLKTTQLKADGNDPKAEEVCNNDDIEDVLNKPSVCQNDELNVSKEYDDKSEDDSEYMFKMHEGLVKIQALIRGFITRCRQKKKNLNLANKQLNKCISQQNNRGSERIPRQRSNQILKKSSSRKIKLGMMKPPSQMNLQVGYDTSSDGGMNGTAAQTTNVNNFESSNDDPLMRSNTEKLNGKNLSDSGQMSNTNSKDTGNIMGSLSQFGGKKNVNLKADWREYFQDEELDKAYQIVEVEQRDETDHESLGDESMGSNSNPSEDNFDEEEVYRNVYGVKNPEQYLEIRKAKEQEFIEKVQCDVISQQNLLNNISNLKTNENANKGAGQKLESEDKTRENVNKSESDNFLKDGSVHQNANTNQEQKTLEEDMLSHSPLRVNQDSEAQQKEQVDKPRVQTSANHSPMNRTEQNQDNLFQNMTSNARRMLKSSIQQRAFTQSQNQHQSNMNVGGQQKPPQQNYKIQHYSNKKENINQVIKDCFITKKMNTKNSKSLVGRQQSGQSISPQKQFQITNKKNKQLNLKMNSISNQFSMSQAGFGAQNPNQQQNPRSNLIKQGSNKKNRLDLQNQSDLQKQATQGTNIEEALQNQNNVLLQKIIQINMKNNLLRQQTSNSNRRNSQNSQQLNTNRMNEVITIQLLERLNQQMSGMNTLQANQYMQIVLMQMLQTNKSCGSNEDEAQVSNIMAYQGSSTEPSSSHNLQFYPQMTQEIIQTNENRETENGQNLGLSQQNIKRLASDHNVPQSLTHNFDMSSTPVVLNRYSNLQGEQEKLQAPHNTQEQGKIYYNSKRKPPSAQKSHKKANQLDSSQVNVSNFHENQSPLKQHLKPPMQSSFNIGGATAKNMGNSFYIERNSMPQDGFLAGHQHEGEQYQASNHPNNSSMNVNQNSSQNLGSSLFMKYIKKKANQEQQNFTNKLYVNASSMDQNSLATQMEYNSAGLPSTGEKVFDINQMIMNPNRKGVHHNMTNESVYQNDPKQVKQSHQIEQNQADQKNLQPVQMMHTSTRHPSNSNRLNSAALQKQQAQQQQQMQGPNMINQEIVNTKELINEIKQMRVHQQLQLQLQQQLQQQLQTQFQMQMNSNDQQQFVQFNQINYYENQKPQVFSDNLNLTKDQLNSLQHQGVVKDMMQHLNKQNRQQQIPQASNMNPSNIPVGSNIINQNDISKQSGYDSSPIKTRHHRKLDNRQQVQLQAEDKIPQGLQALMNKQNNMQDMQQIIMSGGYHQSKAGVNHIQNSKNINKQYTTNPNNKHQYVSHQQNSDLQGVNKERSRRAETRGAEMRKDRQQYQQLIPIQHFHQNSNMKLTQGSLNGQQVNQASIRANSTYKNQNSKSQNNLTQSHQHPQGGNNNLNQQNIQFTIKQQQQQQNPFKQ